MSVDHVQKCVLYERDCIGCMECETCDLDPNKVCDNCGKCIDSGNDYNIMDVDLIPMEGDEPHNYVPDDVENAEEMEEEEFFEDEGEDYNFADDEYESGYDEYDDAPWEDDDDGDGLRFEFGDFF